MGMRVTNDMAYVKKLIGAGWEGIASARQQTHGAAVKAAVWTPAAVGAALGVFGAHFIAKRRKPRILAIGGVVGSAIGFGAAAGWSSRGFLGAAGRDAMRRVNAARDAHWLALNPIDYA